MQRVAVFCGSSSGRQPHYSALAHDLGNELARRQLGLVFGGSCLGLMGEVADAALACNGEVIGVIPRFMSGDEVAHRGLTELRLVDSMHERKAQMMELADAFVVLPGGLGTLEEAFEILTWAQLRIHDKPLAFLDVDDYWKPMMAFLDHSAAEGFLKPRNRALVQIFEDPVKLLDHLANRPGGTTDTTALTTNT